MTDTQTPALSETDRTLLAAAPVQPALPPLTDAQRAILKTAAPDFRLYPVHVLGGDIDLCRSLVTLDLLVEGPVAWFCATDAGRAAVADRPGDGLPESHPTGDMELPVPGELPQDPALQHDVVFTLNHATATINWLTAERDQLARDLADAQTAHNLARELSEKRQARIDELARADERRRETLDRVRRENAELRARLAHSPDVGLEAVLGRLAALEEAVLEPVPYALNGLFKPARREVRTLVQNITAGAKVNADDHLADRLNEGWEIEPSLSGVMAFVNTSGDHAVQMDRRIVTLVREVEDDAAGDAPEAHASLEAAMSASAEPVPAALDTLVPPAPLSHAATYLNALEADAAANADGLMIARAEPLRVVMTAI